MCGLEDEAHQLWHHLNESPSQKEGKSPVKPDIMAYMRDLNESPSQKEGKFDRTSLGAWCAAPQ